ncbi:hypothetical protein D3Z36_17110, partial [Lachnospiraceae bacterium]|nr:hypothetical protein [Lachnospiraceae bacterium]
RKRKNNAIKLCSYTSDEAEKLCLHSSSDTYRMCGVDAKATHVEVLYFGQFYRHFVFAEDEEGNQNRRIERYFEVSAVVDMGSGGTKNQ